MDPMLPGRVLAGLCVAVLCMGVVRGQYTMKNYFELKKSYETLKSVVDGLREQNEKLAVEIENIAASPDYARKVMRDKYHVTDDDEEIIIVDGKE